MINHLEESSTTPTPQGAAVGQPRDSEDHVFDELKEKLPLVVFSCVQLASKLALYSSVSSENPTISYFTISHDKK